MPERFRNPSSAINTFALLNGKLRKLRSASFVKPIYTFIEFPNEFVVDLPDVLLAFVNHYDHGSPAAIHLLKETSGEQMYGTG